MLCPPSTTRAETEKKLLVLNSYSPGYRWTDEIIAGITDVITRSNVRVRVHQESMDTKRNSDRKYFQLLYETYRYKFRGSHFDVIITSDDDAFDFVLEHRNRLFPGTPVVFCGVNDFDPSKN